MAEEVRHGATAGSVALLTCPPDVAAAAHWGDTHFAASFAAALRRLGHVAHVHIRPEWGDDEVAGADLVVHLRGVAAWDPPRTVDQRHVLWIISHPDDVGDDELAAYDLVVVASVDHAAVLARRTTTPVRPLLQATDLHRFRPPPLVPARVEPGIVVVANARWPDRRAPRWLDDLGWDYQLHGANWGRSAHARHWSGRPVDNAVLPDVYATAAVVVADQWGEMSRHGFVANRLFDVAACGGFVVAEDAPGIRAVFGDTVPTWHSRATLDAVLRAALASPARRRASARAAMGLVRSGHGFDHRARSLVALVAALS